jgi:hypothetical protein
VCVCACVCVGVCRCVCECICGGTFPVCRWGEAVTAVEVLFDISVDVLADLMVFFDVSVDVLAALMTRHVLEVLPELELITGSIRTRVGYQQEWVVDRNTPRCQVFLHEIDAMGEKSLGLILHVCVCVCVCVCVWCRTFAYVMKL